MSDKPTATDRTPVNKAEDNSCTDGAKISETYQSMDAERLLHELQVHQNDLNTILENAPLGISKIIDRKQVWVNRKTEEMFQYSKEEMEFQTTRKLYPSDEAYEKLGQEAYPLLAQGLVFQTEQELIRKDGVQILTRYIGKAVNPPDMSKGTIWLLEDITERKAAENAIRESKEKYRAMIEAFDGLVYICSKDYRIEFMNDRMIQRTGRDAVGEYCYKALHDLDAVCEWCQNEKVLKGESVQWEVQSPQDGRWYEVSNTPIYNSDGTISKQALIRDITGRKLTELQLQESESRFRSVVEHTPNMVMIHADNKFVYLNPSAVKAFGITDQQEYIGKQIIEVVHPDFRNTVRERVDRISNENQVSIKREEQLLRKDGTPFWVEITGIPDTHQGNKAVLVVAVDITGRKLAEFEREQYYQFFNITSDMMCIADLAGYFIKLNPIWEKTLGYSEEELLGRPFADFIHPDDKVKTFAVVEENLKRGIPVFRFENRYRCKDGRYKWLSWTSNPKLEKGITYAVARDITQSKQLELEREQFFTFFKTSSDLMCIADPNGAFMQTNPAASAILGYSEAELISKPFIDFVHPEDKQGTLDEMARQQKLGSSFQFENRYICKDGSFRWLSWGAVYNKDENCTYAIARDITERMQYENALRESELFFRESQFAASIGSYRADFIADRWESSEVLDTIFGIGEEYSRTIQGWENLIYPDDRSDMARYLMDEVRANKSAFSKEYRIIRQNDGEIRWVLGLGDLKLDSEGNVISMTGTIQDITNSHLVTEALIESERSLHLSQQVGRIGSYTFDIHGDVWSSSTILDEIFGIGADYPRTLAGWTQILHPDEREQIHSYFIEIIAEHLPFNREYRIVRVNDGLEYWVLGIARIEYDANGVASRMVGIIQDITDRKRSEEEKLALENQLHHAQKLESLGVLAGGIAHDFNNILAVIMGNACLAKMDPENLTDNLTAIEKASERAAGLCRQMLAYAGKAQIADAKVNLDALLLDTVTLLKASIPQNVAIKYFCPADIPCIKADVSQINQVAMNLIMNASEAIGDAQGEVLVKLTVTEIKAERPENDYFGKFIPPGWYACLEVTDNGCGMSDEAYNRIFEPFYSTKFSGRGLGMSAVLGIIQSHKGSLQLSSHLGKGTAFKVYLPVPLKDSTGDENTSAIPSAPWKGIGTILLVEDEDQVRSLANKMLTNFGFTVIEAANGKEGLELYQENATDVTLVMTDMGMPVMDGYELCNELKKLSPELPIIVSSGYGDTEISSRIGSDKIAGLISKPYNPVQLREVLKRVVEGKSSATA